MHFHDPGNDMTMAMATRSRLRPRSYPSYCMTALLIVLLAPRAVKAFVVVPVGPKICTGREVGCPEQHHASVSLFASKKKKGGKTNSQKGSGGFGGGKSSTTKKNCAGESSGIKPVKADKNSLESQWDSFAAITDLEIKPLGDPEDENYEHFEVADVFVRSGNDSTSSSTSSTGWFRIGKICASNEATIEASLTLQKGLIFWTAVHMRRELMALGKASATSLELGYIVPPIVYMGTETDGPMEDDEVDQYLVVHNKNSSNTSPDVLRTIQTKKSFGFRPDWNPPGFTYKRREKAAMKKSKKSAASSRLEDALNDDGSD